MSSIHPSPGKTQPPEAGLSCRADAWVPRTQLFAPTMGGGVILSGIIKYKMVVSCFLISSEDRTRANRLERGSCAYIYAHICTYKSTYIGCDNRRGRCDIGMIPVQEGAPCSPAGSEDSSSNGKRTDPWNFWGLPMGSLQPLISFVPS